MHRIFWLLPMVLLGSCRSNDKEEIRVDTSNIVQQVAGVNKELAISDGELMDRYFQRRGWDYKSTGSGVFYSIVTKGKGVSVRKGITVQISYRITLLNGTVCYGIAAPLEKEFVAGMGKEISGLEEAILLMKEGDRAIVAIPPHLAYGLLGDEDKIPPRSTIIYDLTIVKVFQNS